MKRKLIRKFYTRPTLQVAKDLLGKYLIRRIEGCGKPRRKVSFLRGRIVETEAYIGPEDKASHAYKGKITERNKAEYLEGGYIYIYLVYGMYYQLNISTSEKGRPECVLIRALEPVFPSFKISNSKIQIPNKFQNPNNQNLKRIRSLTNGPGKLCRWMKLDKSFYGEDLTKSKRIWLIGGEKIKPSQIMAVKRIGIDYAGPYWAAKKWRFYIKDNPFVSRK